MRLKEGLAASPPDIQARRVRESGKKRKGRNKQYYAKRHMQGTVRALRQKGIQVAVAKGASRVLLCYTKDGKQIQYYDMTGAIYFENCSRKYGKYGSLKGVDELIKLCLAS